MRLSTSKIEGPEKTRAFFLKPCSCFSIAIPVILKDQLVKQA